jgi:hypothetical protein
MQCGKVKAHECGHNNVLVSHDEEAVAVVTSRRAVSRMFVPVHQTTRCHGAEDPSPVPQVNIYELSRFYSVELHRRLVRVWEESLLA